MFGVNNKLVANSLYYIPTLEYYWQHSYTVRLESQIIFFYGDPERVLVVVYLISIRPILITFVTTNEPEFAVLKKKWTIVSWCGIEMPLQRVSVHCFCHFHPEISFRQVIIYHTVFWKVFQSDPATVLDHTSWKRDKLAVYYFYYLDTSSQCEHYVSLAGSMFRTWVFIESCSWYQIHSVGSKV